MGPPWVAFCQITLTSCYYHYYYYVTCICGHYCLSPEWILDSRRNFELEKTPECTRTCYFKTKLLKFSGKEKSSILTPTALNFTAPQPKTPACMRFFLFSLSPCVHVSVLCRVSRTVVFSATLMWLAIIKPVSVCLLFSHAAFWYWHYRSSVPHVSVMLHKYL